MHTKAHEWPGLPLRSLRLLLSDGLEQEVTEVAEIKLPSAATRF